MSRNLKMVIIDGIKRSGSYNPSEALGYIMESLTVHEYNEATEFMNWAREQKIKYGYGNIDEIYAMWQESKRLTPA